jgi:hypothetical protein
VLIRVLTLNTKTMSNTSRKMHPDGAYRPCRTDSSPRGADSHGGYGVGSASCISWSQTEIIHRVASAGLEALVMLVNMPLAEEPTIRNEHIGLRLRIDIPVDNGLYVLWPTGLHVPRCCQVKVISVLKVCYSPCKESFEDRLKSP